MLILDVGALLRRSPIRWLCEFDDRVGSHLLHLSAVQVGQTVCVQHATAVIGDQHDLQFATTLITPRFDWRRRRGFAQAQPEQPTKRQPQQPTDFIVSDAGIGAHPAVVTDFLKT